MERFRSAFRAIGQGVIVDTEPGAGNSSLAAGVRRPRLRRTAYNHHDRQPGSGMII